MIIIMIMFHAIITIVVITTVVIIMHRPGGGTHVICCSPPHRSSDCTAASWPCADTNPEHADQFGCNPLMTSLQPHRQPSHCLPGSDACRQRRREPAGRKRR